MLDPDEGCVVVYDPVRLGSSVVVETYTVDIVDVAGVVVVVSAVVISVGKYEEIGNKEMNSRK